MATNRLLKKGVFRGPWLRLKQVIRRVTSRRPRFVPSGGSEASTSSILRRGWSSESVDLLSPAPFDSIPPVSSQPLPVDPNRHGKLAISRLPPELLAQTFLLVCEASELADYSWIVCSHICSYWRQIALDTPDLWSHVVFTSVEWVRLCIRRSKSSPLIIEASLADRRVEALVSAVLKLLAERIGRIAVRFESSHPTILLAGPFPMLTSLWMENNSWWSTPDIPFNSDVDPYPRLRSLSLRTNIAFLPPLPAQLVSLEITSVGDLGWTVFSDALKPLVELEILQLKGFPVPPVSTSSSMISLPKLRELHLSASPAYCTQFIQILECPCVRQWRLDLFNVTDIGDMFRIVLGNLHQPPSPWCCTGNLVHPLHAIIGFSYADARDLAHCIFLDIAFCWKIPLDDPALAAIFAAVSEIPVINTIQWFSLIDWNFTRHFARACIRSIMGSHQAVGGSVLGDVALCGWIARQRHGQSPVNSYVDLDGARFLELLVCYLELRPIQLQTLRLLRCFNYTIAEVKLLRRLVGELLWDAVGALGTTYGDNGDQFGAMTINHDLLSSRPGYEESNLTEEERWKRRWW
ncbi:hypothetical protein B0H12DRAFT_1235778 [Mycena haematopus]|nr:hypothetical protein B0H12DRAFT_1235778 [Mycena haematopus]